jgi:tyrosyl-tRNA synthetase
MPILEGLDGVQKMSKSLNNYIGVAEAPGEMFGKMLSISDELMWRYYELLSHKSLAEIAQLRSDVEAGNAHPKTVKEALAQEIVERFHSVAAAAEAKAEFDRVHAKSELPSDMPEYELDGPIWIAKALQECGLEASTSQARRDLKQGAVKIDQQKVDDEQLQLEAGEYILQVGKRKFACAKVK